MKEETDGDKEIHLSLCMKELINAQSDDTFCSTILKLINETMVSSDKYFISESRLLYKVMREDEKWFHALVIPIIFSKYVLHQVHDVHVINYC